jgi:hypothetical protein
MSSSHPAALERISDRDFPARSKLDSGQEFPACGLHPPLPWCRDASEIPLPRLHLHPPRWGLGAKCSDGGLISLSLKMLGKFLRGEQMILGDDLSHDDTVFVLARGQICFDS